MKRVGLDFGTTNSIISYLNNNGQIESFSLAVHQPAYIPSAVAYRTFNGIETVSIGREAKLYKTDPYAKVYEKFKLMLGESQERLAGYGFNEYLPEKVIRDFFRELFAGYCAGQEIKEIEELVVTVPEIWLREERHRTAREKLKDICRELKLPLKKLISEPVAACAYFCHAYKIKNNHGYKGHVLVVDYGGGTLDISLCEVINGTEIKVLDSSGKGEHEINLGCGGVAFDEAVAERLYQIAGGETIDRNLLRRDKNFIKLVDEFEQRKIDMTGAISKLLRQYCMDETLVDGTVIFNLECGSKPVSVYCDLLKSVFDEVNLNELTTSLEKITNCFDEFNVDPHNQEKFHVLLVGGFSNYYLVERAIRNFFNSQIDDYDERFRSYFTNVDRSLAISKGAALVANDIIQITLTCPYTIGIVGWTLNNGKFTEIDLTGVRKGQVITETDLEPHYIEQAEISIPLIAGDQNIKLFFVGNNRIECKLDHSIRELFPNIDTPNNRWRIGFLVDQNLIPTIFIKDIQNDEKQTSLHELITRLSGPIINSLATTAKPTIQANLQNKISSSAVPRTPTVKTHTKKTPHPSFVELAKTELQDFIVKQFQIFVDTSSLMHFAAEDFFNKLLGPILVENKKPLILPKRVIDELEKNQASSKEDTATKAVKGLSIVENFKALNILETGHDKFDDVAHADNVFHTVFTKFSLTNNMLLLTNDLKLAKEIFALNNRTSVMTNKRIEVRKINQYGLQNKINFSNDNEEIKNNKEKKDQPLSWDDLMAKK